jgi:hypothetical protein
MTADQAFAKTALYTDGELYCLVHLPFGAVTAGAGVLAEIASPFSALILDKDEVTLVVPQAHWEAFAGRLPDYQVAADYRLITFDLPLDLQIVGFMALVSGILARAQIPVFALSSFARDHLLVPAAQYQAAWDALRAAQARPSAG